LKIAFTPKNHLPAGEKIRGGKHLKIAFTPKNHIPAGEKIRGEANI